jgi:hypothetical protein
MDMEQLMQELEMLKAESAAGKAEKRMGGFIDKYGTKFNGNTGIANLILAEMDRRGVSEASEAASEAVQSVLDQLRQEATAILDETKGAMAQVSDLVNKVDEIQQAVDAAGGGGGLGGMPPEEAAPMGAPALPPESADLGAAPPVGEIPPEMPIAPAPAEEMPAEAPGLEGAPPLGGDLGAVPPEAPAPGTEEPIPPAAEEPLPPEQLPSDVRLKNIKSKFAAYAASKKAVPSDENLKKVWRPSKSMLAGVRGGL